MKFLLFGVVLAQVFYKVQAAGKVVCYFGSYGDFPIEQIDPRLCTHINFAFVGISSQGDVIVKDPGRDLPSGGNRFGKFNALRNVNPNLRTLVAIGGGSEGSARFSAVVGNTATRSRFIQNAVDFVKKYDFNGMDLDWEYPAQGEGSSPADKDNFLLLLREMSRKFRENGLLLTSAVSAVQGSVAASFGEHVVEISNYLDFINVMTYDFHGDWFKVTGQTAPLYPSSIDRTAWERALCVQAGIRNWLSLGAPAHKLILGIATYGNTFTLASSSNRALGAPAVGKGPNGGAYGYNQICAKLKQGGWTNTWDEEQQVPFMSRGTEWVGYDNMESIKRKIRFAKSLGLGGAMIWSLGTDDYEGNCHGMKYPLLRAINQELGLV